MVQHQVLRVIPYPQVKKEKLRVVMVNYFTYQLVVFLHQVKFLQMYYEDNFALMEITAPKEKLYPTCITSEALSANATCRSGQGK